MNINSKTYVKSLGVFLLIFIIGGVLLNTFVFNNPVFNFNPNERQGTEWEGYLDERDKRNKQKMKRSYGELMEMGKYYFDEENWELSIENFFYAKTLFPDRIEPRKYLCYGYLMKCQEDWRFCNKGKKELYYAMKYVQPTDQSSYNYLFHLVELVGLDEIVDMEEGDALAAIY